MIIDSTRIENVTEFVYLGSLWSRGITTAVRKY